MDNIGEAVVLLFKGLIAALVLSIFLFFGLGILVGSCIKHNKTENITMQKESLIK